MLDGLRGGSPASYAIRFAAGFPGMLMVLSGMSSLSQMEDNIAFMRDFRPLDERELAAVKRVQEIFHSKNLIPCTVCRYCTDGCPKHISIPDLFATMNTKQIHHGWNADYYYNVVHIAPPAAGRPTASSAAGARRSVPSTCPSAVFWRTLQKNLKRKRTDMKALIAFYSRAGENYFGGAYRRISVGNTEQAARMLAAVTGADTLRIEQVQPYSEDYKACVAEAREDWQCGARPALVNLPESLDGYDEIYLGYPNYCGTMPMAVYTFLEHYDFTGKTIRPFCTHEGSGNSDTESDIRRAAPGAAVTKGLAIHGSHVAEAESALARWVREGK